MNYGFQDRYRTLVRQNGAANTHLKLKVLGVANIKKKLVIDLISAHLAAHYFNEFDLFG